jgi:hypothetical protein
MMPRARRMRVAAPLSDVLARELEWLAALLLRQPVRAGIRITGLRVRVGERWISAPTPALQGRDGVATATAPGARRRARLRP